MTGYKITTWKMHDVTVADQGWKTEDHLQAIMYIPLSSPAIWSPIFRGNCLV